MRALLRRSREARRANKLRKFCSPADSAGGAAALDDSLKTPFHDLVRRLDVRLRLLGVTRELGYVAGATAAALLVPRLFGDGIGWLPLAVAAAGTAVVAYRSVSGLRAGRGLDRAAAAGDRAGGLHDELASAQWFSGAAAPGVWETHQIARARERADDLDPADLLPIRVPRASILAAAALALLAVVLPLTEGSLIPEALRARIAAGLSGIGDGPTAGDPLTGPEALEDVNDARVEARSPEDILAELRAGELRLPEDSAEDLDALTAALAASMEERAFQETSEEVSAALAGLAEALNSESFTASEWLESLSDAMRSASTPDELQALLESLEAGAEGDALGAAAAEMMELMEAGLSADEALQQLAENLQAMEGQPMNGQGAGEAQQMPFPGDGEGGQPQAGEGGEPAAGMPQGAAGLSGQVQMMAAEGQMGAPIPMDAGPAGNMTGPGGGGESEVFGASTSLEVQLELEAIPTPLDEEPVPEQMIERQSRREDASVAYGSVTSLAEYADEIVSRTRPIPAGLRPLVRAYFLRIRETAPAAADEAPAADEGPNAADGPAAQPNPPDTEGAPTAGAPTAGAPTAVEPRPHDLRSKEPNQNDPGNRTGRSAHRHRESRRDVP